MIKTIVNGGTATSADFEITVSGTAVDGGTTSFPGQDSPGITLDNLSPGDFSVGETDPGVEFVVTTSGDCSGTLAAGDVKTCTITNTRILNVSAGATMWVGLQNTDDIGTNFDVIVQVLRNGGEIASGVALCQTPPRTPPVEVSVPLTLTGSGQTSSGDVIAVKVFARIGTTDGVTFCGGHSDARGLRLYYDSVSIASEATDLFLHSDGNACTASVSTGVTTRFLDGTAPTATSAKCQDSGGVNFSGGNILQQIGGDWTLTVP